MILVCSNLVLITSQSNTSRRIANVRRDRFRSQRVQTDLRVKLKRQGVRSFFCFFDPRSVLTWSIVCGPTSLSIRMDGWTANSISVATARCSLKMDLSRVYITEIALSSKLLGELHITVKSSINIAVSFKKAIYRSLTFLHYSH